MKIIALGANLPSVAGAPRETLYAALIELSKRGVTPTVISRVWKTAPVPFEESQPWYYNAVAAVETEQTPQQLLRMLLDVERSFGRVRELQNEPRTLDLDLIAFDDVVIADDPSLTLPHPRMEGRGFVLLPMTDILDDWRHPVSKKDLQEMVAALPRDQQAVPMENGWEPV